MVDNSLSPRVKMDTGKPITILHLEDNLNDVTLVRATLSKADFEFRYLITEREIEFCSLLRTESVDLILSDYHLPDYSGSQALVYAKANFPQTPFIFLSGTMGEDVAIESLLNGATDYVLKNKMERLVPAVQRAIKEAEELKARKNAEQELRKLSRAVEQSPNSIIITNTSGIIEYVNPTTQTLSGYTSTELVGENPRIFSSGEHSRAEYVFLWSTISAGKVWKGEFHNKKKSGELYWESIIISPILDSTGVITHFLAIKEDITARKLLTQELITAKEKAEESDRLKSAFLANMSHEIRTPMNAILGFTKLLKKPNLSYLKQANYIGIIEKGGNRLLNIINDLIDISKIEAGQMKVSISSTDINEQIKYIFTFFKPEVDEKGIQFTHSKLLPENEATLFTDREKVYSILTNLVKNAIKFTPSGSIGFGYEKKNEYFQFHVKDTGIGIPKVRQDAIFERFVQADIGDKKVFQGAGLGLSISKAYVEMLGGKIWVESEEGKGSTFYFTLPCN